MIRFQFDPAKAIQAMGYIVERLQTVNKVVLMKLMYIADRDHFLEHGYPITGDRLVAMPYGPVPSACLDLLDTNEPVSAFDVLHIDDVRVTLKRRPESHRLSSSEVAVLDAVIQKHGSKPAWSRYGRRGIVDETHNLPEYQEHYEEGTSTTIPFESILKHSGNPSHFRHNRPVISEATAAHMIPDFRAAPDTDL